MIPNPDETFVLQTEVTEAAQALTREAFLSRYDCPMLWVVAPPGTVGASSGVTPRDIVESYRRTILQDDSVEADPAAAAAYLERVGLVRKRPNNLFPNMISVGRAGNSDLVAALGTVSKLHAYFLRDGDKWSLTDWNSTNGTTLDGERLKARESVPLESGTTISFGKELRGYFFLASDLYDELRSPQPFVSMARSSA